eukprot:CAMPEP_0178998764 /NCGR_PEP_ID=MMETSP0795-20121207/9684_1 /TAXON_ID=88552 /ORGANISM="Amoebophrya sp., Strain Ameob2" /LENGTH=440 /DNA_ID=CAMNT_0020691459 /DNA_START=69 /DNA_END=1394 /DNA_ORIENTATION=-
MTSPEKKLLLTVGSPEKAAAKPSIGKKEQDGTNRPHFAPPPATAFRQNQSKASHAASSQIHQSTVSPLTPSSHSSLSVNGDGTTGQHPRADRHHVDHDHLSRSLASDGSAKDSQHEYAMSHQTILLFDWDDTLCPSSFCRHTLNEQLICKVWQECCNLTSTPDEEKGSEPLAASVLDDGDEGINEGKRPVSMPGTYVEAWDKKSKLEEGRDICSWRHLQLEEERDIDIPQTPTPIDPVLSPRLLRGQQLAREYYDKLVHDKHKLQLDQVAQKLIWLLKKAKTLAKVVIVTNAETGWIELSCKAWLSAALPEVLSCRLVSARSSYEQPSGSKSPAGWKADAFRDVVRDFYITRSWKNIISIGDAPHEREAVFRIQADANHPSCRVKSVKLQVRPKVPEVLRQMNRLAESLPDVIAADCNLDLEFIPETAAFEDMFGSGKAF